MIQYDLLSVKTGMVSLGTEIFALASQKNIFSTKMEKYLLKKIETIFAKKNREKIHMCAKYEQIIINYVM